MSTQEVKLKDIADSIRIMDGTTNTIVANTFKDRIRAIPQKEGPHEVRFFDFDGTLLKSEFVHSGGNATFPINPSHDQLEFMGWTHTQEELNNIQYRPSERGLDYMPGHIDVGAMYRTTNNITHLFAEPNEGGGKAITLQFHKVSSNVWLNIDWDDGSAIERYNLTVATATRPKTYTTMGPKHIRIWTDDNLVFGMGNGTTTTQIVSVGYQLIKKAYIADNVALKNYTFYNWDNLDFVVYPRPGTIGEIPNFTFSGCKDLAHLTIPRGYTTIPQDFVRNTTSMFSIVIPETITTLGVGAFYLTPVLNRIILPKGIDTIPNTFFDIGSAKQIISDILHTLGTNAINSWYLLEKFNLAKKVNFGGGLAIANPYNLSHTNLEMNLLATTSNLAWFHQLKGYLVIGSDAGVLVCPGVSNFNNLSTLIIKDNFTSLSGAIANPSCMFYVSLATTPPTIANSNYVNALSKVSIWYVPDIAVATYKAATNWTAIANYIYPLSSAPAWLQQLIGEL